jgi:hypothetical protein
MWVKRGRTSHSTYEVMASKYTSTMVPIFHGADLGTINTVAVYSYSFGIITESTIAIAETTTWHHLVFAKNGASAFKLYIDGVDRTGTVTDRTLVNTAQPLVFSADINNATPSIREKFFKGNVDEIRVSNNYQSADWVVTTYNNQNSPSTFYTIGNESSPSFLFQPVSPFIPMLAR